MISSVINRSSRFSPITHREDAIWHALLPGGLEHKLLMGMPREPTIYQKVNEVVECLDVHITPGGASWLHAVVQVNKHSNQDGKAAIEAAFQGHRSCKHVFIVGSRILIFMTLPRWNGLWQPGFRRTLDMVVLPLSQGPALTQAPIRNRISPQKLVLI